MQYVPHRIVSTVLLVALVCLPWYAYGQVASPAPTLTPTASTPLISTLDDTVQSLGFLKNKINQRYEMYVSASSQMADIQSKLDPIQLKVTSLTDEIKTLDDNITDIRSRVTELQNLIHASQLKLSDLFDLQAVREKQAQISGSALKEFLRMAYLDILNLGDGSSDDVSTLKLLLADTTLADTQLRQQYLTVLQHSAASLIAQASSAEQRYADTRAQVLTERGQLVAFQDQKISEQASLDDIIAAKNKLLDETKGQESEYKKMLDDYARQQADSLREIGELRENMMTINAKLKELVNGGKMSQDDINTLLTDQGLQPLSTNIAFVNTPHFIWPADPARGITAYFKDPEYLARFGVPHFAIDFREYQGTPIHAAAPGVVAKVHDGGMGYSYLVLAHADDFQTVYGHLSHFDVQEGDTVAVGQLVGRSGATPGTPGAGLMTTGPHLHFEVIKNGEHEDPLQYLPLEYLPIADVPDKYIKK